MPGFVSGSGVYLNFTNYTLHNLLNVQLVLRFHLVAKRVNRSKQYNIKRLCFLFSLVNPKLDTLIFVTITLFARFYGEHGS